MAIAVDIDLHDQNAGWWYDPFSDVAGVHRLPR